MHKVFSLRQKSGQRWVKRIRRGEMKYKMRPKRCQHPSTKRCNWGAQSQASNLCRGSQATKSQPPKVIRGIKSRTPHIVLGNHTPALRWSSCANPRPGLRLTTTTPGYDRGSLQQDSNLCGTPPNSGINAHIGANPYTITLHALVANFTPWS